MAGDAFDRRGTCSLSFKGRLPAVAAAAATATAAAALTTTTAAEAAAAALTTAATAAAKTATAAAGGTEPAATAAAKATLFARTSFFHFHGTATELIAIQGCDCVVAFLIVGHFDEANSTHLAGITVAQQVDTVHGSVISEQLQQLVIADVVGQVAHKNIFHRSKVSLPSKSNTRARKTHDQ